jgi:Nsp1-like C-terminal region
MAVPAAKCMPQPIENAVEQARALVQAPSEIKGKNVEAIIAGWTAELEARSAAFVAHAGRLAEWDRHILTNRRELLDLEDELQRVMEFEIEFEVSSLVLHCRPYQPCKPTATHRMQSALGVFGLSGLLGLAATLPAAAELLPEVAVASRGMKSRCLLLAGRDGAGGA